MSKPKTAKPKIKSARSKYKPPIPWERLEAMQRAVSNYTYHGEQFDRPMATEILHALSHLSGVFQKELLNRSGRPFAKETWWAAAITLFLLENHVANSVGDAVAAAVGVCFPPPGQTMSFAIECNGHTTS